MAAFDARLKALEGYYFQAEQKLAVEKHVENLVKQGRLPKTSLQRLGFQAASSARSSLPAFFDSVPTEVRKGHAGADFVFDHTKRAPASMPNVAANLNLGTRISLGRSRWLIDDASIFSVADGKRLAQTPVKETCIQWEVARMQKIRSAAMDSPLVGGYRLLPEMTAGRAFFWGSMLALWGTVATVKLASRAMGIEKVEDASDKMRGIMSPIVHGLGATFQPLKDWLSMPTGRSTDFCNLKLSKKLREYLGGRA